MTKYLKKVQSLVPEFKFFEISHVTRAENAWADTLSRLAISAVDLLDRAYVEHLEVPRLIKV